MASVPVGILPLGILQVTPVEILPFQLLFFICVFLHVDVPVYDLRLAPTVVVLREWLFSAGVPVDKGFATLYVQMIYAKHCKGRAIIYEYYQLEQFQSETSAMMFTRPFMGMRLRL